jgi:uncharacterized delta-60 repeat protein
MFHLLTYILKTKKIICIPYLEYFLKRINMKKAILVISILIGITTNAQVGGLDLSFGDNGKTITPINNNEKAYGIAIQDDGKIVVAGYTSNPTFGDNFVCIRYNTDGTLDNTFGVNGIVENDILVGSDDRANSIAIQSDGKIILAGYSDDGSNTNAALWRINADGTTDSSFGNNGVVVTSFEDGQQDFINVVKINVASGKIVVGGESVISSSLSKPVLARYNTDGSIDTSFNSNGIKLLWVTSLDDQYTFSLEDFEMKPNGKITAVGWRDFPGQSWSSDYWVCKVNSNGTMDTTFSTDGVATYNGGFNGHDRAYSMLLKSNDNIIISGGAHVNNLNYDFSIFELSPTGSVVDSGTSLDFDTTILADDTAYGLAEDNNGKYIMVGSSGNNADKSIALTRVNENLTIDNDFGNNGQVITQFDNNDLNEVFDVAIQTDNKIVVVGYTGDHIVVARYIVEENLSINSQNSINFAIYPNPTTNYLHIDGEINDSEIYIYNNVGQLIKKTRLTEERIDVSELSIGFYFLKINNSK